MSFPKQIFVTREYPKNDTSYLQMSVSAQEAIDTHDGSEPVIIGVYKFVKDVKGHTEVKIEG